ncbi:metal-sulfur cluster assembly factor [Polymorphobacter multimanifer]|uniref:Metal-sulfur cluster biosynthetic enzyme n=1 Tax=Polymorphobacter multimanifer TaxID=1070431 RepID=A0A841LFF3_9SPHN|nr:iron-sulfur cluster assembly protein [Polymorphobacter multimanifer]MBB6227892.1 metal-sulfur cluster biosynthetic enzyme [Polymorphobacter multimanifer]
MSLRPAIEATLARIHDPCSVAAGRPLSLPDMGLVRGWSYAAGTLHLHLAVTFAGCTMAPHFAQAAREALLAIPAIAHVHVTIDTDFAWTPDLIRHPAPLMTGIPQAWRSTPRKVITHPSPRT